MKRILSLFIFAVIIIAICGGSNNQRETDDPKVKNLIVLISDGTSLNSTGLARYMLKDNKDGQKNLYISNFFQGLVKTSWANGPVTDSAASATAYSTGYKTIAKYIGIDEELNPHATILEGAKHAGMKTGMVATKEFMDATPAAFSSHEKERSNYEIIAKQMIHQDLDVYLGTGSDYLNKTSLDDISSLGYSVVQNKKQMLESNSQKLWGDFKTPGNKKTMSFDYDRNDEEPSLSEMTSKAIEVLENDSGFFLMVEGSKIDTAAHMNDTVGIISDVLAFDEAFKVAVDFAKENQETVVVGLTDHGNSGITIGSDRMSNYANETFDIFDPLRLATKTATGAMDMLKSDNSNIDEVLYAYGVDVNQYHETDSGTKLSVFNRITKFKEDPSKDKLIDIVNRSCYIGYTTTGHTGDDLPIYVYAPKGFYPNDLLGINGMYDNTEITSYLSKIIGVDLDLLTEELYLKVYDQKTLQDYDVEINEYSNVSADNSGYIYSIKATITIGEKKYEVNSNSNIALDLETGKTIKLKGLVLYILDENNDENKENGKLFIPKFID